MRERIATIDRAFGVTTALGFWLVVAEYDGTNWSLVTTATLPPARRAAAMAWDSTRQKTVLFSGTAGGGVSPGNETWEFDGSNWSLATPTTKPPSRLEAAMAYDPVRARVVLFAGTGSLTRNDTWEYDGTTWTQRLLAVAPPRRIGASLTFDASINRLVLTGGFDVPLTPATRRADSSPRPRWRAGSHSTRRRRRRWPSHRPGPTTRSARRPR